MTVEHILCGEFSEEVNQEIGRSDAFPPLKKAGIKCIETYMFGAIYFMP